MPQLADPNFSRAVVLMIEHSEQGSFGLVINHPSPIKASELLDSLEMSWCGEDSAVVWAGGPVSPSTGWVLHEPVGGTQPGTIEITSTISLSTSPDRLRAIANQPPRNVRLLLGYSGWGPVSSRRRWRAARGCTPRPIQGSCSRRRPTKSGIAR